MTLCKFPFPPGLSNRKPQFVLVTENGKERTSNVTQAKIFKAVYEVKDHGFASLESCVPVAIGPKASAYGISYYDDSSLAVYFKVNDRMLRMIGSDYTYEDATEIMCSFFERYKLPNMDGWLCQDITPKEQATKAESHLTVDGEEFRYFGPEDVIAALENIRDGKSRELYYDFDGKNGGYIDIWRCDDVDGRPACKVEWVRWEDSQDSGYRTVVTDFSILHKWVTDLARDKAYPEVTEIWDSFKIKDYFERIIFKYFNKDDNNDER